MKTQKTFRTPALAPVSMFVVEFATPDEKKQPSEKLTRTIAGTDEVDFAKAANRYFTVELINPDAAGCGLFDRQSLGDVHCLAVSL